LTATVASSGKAGGMARAAASAASSTAERRTGVICECFMNMAVSE
jgi:hypothetical protein